MRPEILCTRIRFHGTRAQAEAILKAMESRITSSEEQYVLLRQLDLDRPQALERQHGFMPENRYYQLWSNIRKQFPAEIPDPVPQPFL